VSTSNVRRFAVGLLVVLVGVCGAALAHNARAATEPPAANGHAARAAARAALLQDPSHKHFPPGTISGQDRPELIPTTLAVRMMLRTIASAAERDSRTGTRHVSAYLNGVGGPIVEGIQQALDLTQRGLIVAAALDYARETERNAVLRSGASFAATADAKADQLWTRLRATMHHEAFDVVDQFVQKRVKRGITVRP
jgi:hypothetical protein